MNVLESNPNSTPEYVTVEQFRRIFNIGTTTVYALIGDGTLRSIKVGKRRLVNYPAARDHFRSLEADR